MESLTFSTGLNKAGAQVVIRITFAKVLTKPKRVRPLVTKSLSFPSPSPVAVYYQCTFLNLSRNLSISSTVNICILLNIRQLASRHAKRCHYGSHVFPCHVECVFIISSVDRKAHILSEVHKRASSTNMLLQVSVHAVIESNDVPGL